MFQYDDYKELVEMPDEETAYEYQFVCLECHCKVLLLEEWSRLEKFEVIDQERATQMENEELIESFRLKNKQLEWMLRPQYTEVEESANALRNEMNKRMKNV
ncbi:hypothetical protein U3A55_02375 [Salarchaeum sp. III]